MIYYFDGASGRRPSWFTRVRRNARVRSSSVVYNCSGCGVSSRRLIVCPIHGTFQKTRTKKGSAERMAYNNYIHIILVFVFLCLYLCLFLLVVRMSVYRSCVCSVCSSRHREKKHVYTERLWNKKSM